MVFTNALNNSDTNPETQRSNYTIDSMCIEDKKVDKLNEYMDLFKDKYNLDKIARLPSKTI